MLIEDEFSIELTIHGLIELRHRPRSSTDGKPIIRLSIAHLKALCEAEHGESWSRYIASGELPSFETLRALESAAGSTGGEIEAGSEGSEASEAGSDIT